MSSMTEAMWRRKRMIWKEVITSEVKVAKRRIKLMDVMASGKKRKKRKNLNGKNKVARRRTR